MTKLKIILRVQGKCLIEYNKMDFLWNSLVLVKRVAGSNKNVKIQVRVEF